MFFHKLTLFPVLAILPCLAAAQTTVTLTTSSNPSVFGAPLTLTATLSTGSPGWVTFFDGVNIVGIKPAVSGAASVSTTLLSAGSHRLTAYYRDNANSAAGHSNAITQTVKAVAVGAFVAQTPLASPAISGPSNTLIVADFNGDGKPDLAATATDVGSWWQVDLGVSEALSSIVIWNRTDCCGSRLGDFWAFVSNTPFSASDTPATLQNRAGTFGSHQTFAPSPSTTIPVAGAQGRYVRVQLSYPGYLSLAEVQVFGAGQSGMNLALGKTATQSSTYQGYTSARAASAVDGNTDGNFADGSVTSTSLYVVSVALGNGDGTFLPPVSYGASAGVIASGDFNGDGNTDLALYDYANVTVLFNNGDGTFRPAIVYPVDTPVTSSLGGFTLSSSGIAVGSFKGDGKADIVTGFSFYCCGPLMGGWDSPATLLPGNGDGTFASPVSYPGVPPPYAMADFNGDGKPDLAGGGFVPNLPVVLGDGDGSGTLLGSRQLGSTSFPAGGGSLLTGDFNDDGKPDVVAGDDIFLGNGDGTFQPPLSFSGTARAMGDFNGDGILDLVVVDGSDNLIGIQYGNGDGTFRQGLAVSGGSVLGVADFNGDGMPDILIEGSGGLTVLLGSASLNLTLTASGGTPQSTTVGTDFRNPLQVTVKDGSGNPVSGVAVTFIAADVSSNLGARLSSSSATTNASGVASVTATANSFPGTYTITASLFALSTSFTLTNLSQAGSDLAVGKTATQSSTFPGYPSAAAISAVDGNTDGNFPSGSVTSTNLDPNAWWQIDLGASATVNSIVIWNRTDCCSERLTDYWVFVSDTPFQPGDTPATLQNRAGTFASHQTSAPLPSATILAAAQGRYLRVQLSGPGYLSLAEVQVFGTGGTPTSSNLSQGKSASQSSIFPGYASDGAAAAVDGNNDGNFTDGSVTATNLDPNPWWQVDLGTSAAVSSVAIWNRTDCCGSRLSDYWVFVSDTPFQASDTPATLQNRAGTFASHQTSAPPPSATIMAGVQGRYVRVQLSGPGYLSLAEVQVFGTGGTPPQSSLSQGKSASQSSTLAGYSSDTASSAVDGSTDGAFFDGSVTATNLDPNPWWQVDLGASATVNSVVVWNRTDCCGDRLSDFWVFVSNTPFLATDTPATLQNRAGTFAVHLTSAPNPSTTINVNGFQGQYVRVQLSGPNYLSLAEVQVFGQ